MLVYLLSHKAKDKKVGNTSKLRETPKACKIERFKNRNDKITMDTKTCNTCEIQYPVAMFCYKKDSRTGKGVTSLKCKTCFSNEVKANKKNYYQQHKEQHTKYNSDPMNKARRNNRLKERKKQDPMFRINESLKVRIHEILKGYKNCSSSSLLDCKRDHLLQWLTFNFDEGMTMENHGTYWHIDHVVPVSFFDNINKSEQRLCFHWTNLRPLQKSLNISKSNTIDKSYIINHYKTLTRFCEINQGYQVDAERCLWQRFELWYGKNPQDDVAFNEQLKWAIRSQVPNPVNDKGMEKVQRLNASGLELANHQQ
jgi:hypothetical protein